MAQVSESDTEVNTMITASRKGNSIMSSDYTLNPRSRDDLIELLNEVANTVGMMDVYTEFDPVENDLYDLVQSVSAFQTHLNHWYLEPGDSVRLIGDPANYADLSDYGCPDDAIGEVIAVNDDTVVVTFKWTLESLLGNDEDVEMSVWVDYNDVELE